MPHEQIRKLEWADEVVDKGRVAMKEIGEALRHIRDTGAWKSRYSSFEECCEKRWGFKKSTAYNLMKIQDLRSLLLGCSDDDTKGDVESLKDAQVMSLSNVEPKRAIDIIRKIKKQSGKVTVSKINAALGVRKEPQVETIKPDILPPKTACCPHCHQPLPRIKRKTEIPD